MSVFRRVPDVALRELLQSAGAVVDATRPQMWALGMHAHAVEAVASVRAGYSGQQLKPPTSPFP